MSHSAEVEYQNSAMVNPIIFSAQPNPLIINIAYHSADYLATYWQIDSSEASRVLAYWRAGAYHVEPTGVDGYAPGAAAATARGTLTFGAGQTRKTIKVMGKGDTAVEADEKFFVNLSSPVGATLADGQGTGTIRNDD